MKLELTLLPSQKKKRFSILGWSLKVSIILGRLVVVEIMLGFRAKVLVILIKCSLKMSDNFLSSETIQFFYEIIILLEK